VVDVEVLNVATGTGLYTYVLPTSATPLPPLPILSSATSGFDGTGAAATFQATAAGTSAGSGAVSGGSGSGSSLQLMQQSWMKWLMQVKQTLEQNATNPIGAEQVVGTFDPSQIPPIPWTTVLKAGSSLADLETRNAADLAIGTVPPARITQT